MNRVQYDIYYELFGKWNRFTEWLYDILMYHSMKFYVAYDRMHNISDIELIDNYGDNLLEMNYEDVYNKFDYHFYIPSTVNYTVMKNKLIYRYPLIKALYYSYKHLDK